MAAILPHPAPGGDTETLKGLCHETELWQYSRILSQVTIQRDIKRLSHEISQRQYSRYCPIWHHRGHKKLCLIRLNGGNIPERDIKGTVLRD
jgi:hypothetical protein